MTGNDVGGEWMEVVPNTAPSQTITLTRARPAEIASNDAIALVCITLGVVGIVALVLIYYLHKKERI